jgi:dTDP-4-amino-4,6-dideoxygalactose transaminase
MQSAIGRVQLGKLDKWLEKRRKNAEILIDGLSEIPGLRLPVPDAHVGHAWYKFYAYVEPERLKPGWSRDRIMQAVADKGVPCMQGICPEVYLEKAFQCSGQWSVVGGREAEVGRLPVAKELGETSLMFLVHPTLEAVHMQKTVQVVRDVMGEAVG